MKNRLNMWIFFPVIDDDCERIHSSCTSAHCFDSAYVAKQPVAWEEYCFGVLVKRTPGTIDRWTGRRGNTVESGVKHHTINHLLHSEGFTTGQHSCDPSKIGTFRLTQICLCYL